jgi:hypothetical protein
VGSGGLPDYYSKYEFGWHLATTCKALDAIVEAERLGARSLAEYSLAVEAESYRRVFNHIRPHEALDFARPAEIHSKINRRTFQPRNLSQKLDAGTSGLTLLFSTLKRGLRRIQCRLGHRMAGHRGDGVLILVPSVNPPGYAGSVRS